jgi:prepilin-type processing-associated H-X9-DG protein
MSDVISTTSPAIPVARTNYGFSYGDAVWNVDRLVPEQGNPPGGLASGTNRAGRDDVRSRRMFVPLVNLTDPLKDLGAIADGTSNTVAMGEFGKPAVAQTDDARSGIIRVWFDTGGTAPANESVDQPGIIRRCLNGANGKTLVFATNGAAMSANYGPIQSQWARGQRPQYAQAMYVAFSTTLPPNSPNCISDNSDGARGMWHAGSYHTGGANVVFFDGSVRFITETIDFGATTSRQVTSGPSQFGVWGALGTPDGGESASL